MILKRETVVSVLTVSLFSVMNPVFFVVVVVFFLACLNSVDSIITYFLAVIFAQVVFSQTKPANWVICWPSLCQLVLLYSLVYFFIFVFLLGRCDQLFATPLSFLGSMFTMLRWVSASSAE